MNKCLCCAKEMTDKDALYHSKCRDALFGKNIIPCLNYSLSELNEIAKSHLLNRISVPGVQPKLSLHLENTKENGRGRLTLVGLNGDYILKPPVSRWKELPEAEHFCMMFARRCGIQTADFCLIPLATKEFAYLSKRMDRTTSAMLHMEDFCQILNKQTSLKYNGSMEQIGKAIRLYSTSPGLDSVRLFELSVFCFLTGNSDMHLKNFSLLHKDVMCNELSPAYDLVPVKCILPEDEEDMALTLNGKKLKIKQIDFEKFGVSLRLSMAQIKKTMNRIKLNVQQNMAETINDSFLSEEKKDKIGKFILNQLHRLSL